MSIVSSLMSFELTVGTILGLDFVEAPPLADLGASKGVLRSSFYRSSILDISLNSVPSSLESLFFSSGMTVRPGISSVLFPSKAMLNSSLSFVFVSSVSAVFVS
jgi:hypothetical protein